MRSLSFIGALLLATAITADVKAQAGAIPPAGVVAEDEAVQEPIEPAVERLAVPVQPVQAPRPVPPTLATTETDCENRNDDDGDGYCEAGRDLNMDGDCADDGEPGGPGDCNDADAAVNPDATELCADTIDNECDGLIDGEDGDDCGDFYDDDGDGYCEVGRDANMDGDCLDPGEPDGPSDCNDMNAEVNPGHTEVTEAECMNLLDDDCDLTIDAADPGCDSFSDPDGDGYCPMGRDLNMDGDCLDDEEMGGDGPFDCDQGNAAINPHATEDCDAGLDNACHALRDPAVRAL